MRLTYKQFVKIPILKGIYKPLLKNLYNEYEITRISARAAGYHTNRRHNSDTCAVRPTKPNNGTQ